MNNPDGIDTLALTSNLGKPKLRSMKDLANDAINVQDACNLSGVVHSFSRIMTELRAIANTEGWANTDKINQHPICILFADKIASLACPGSSLSGCGFTHAYNWASDITAGISRSNFG